MGESCSVSVRMVLHGGVNKGPQRQLMCSTTARRMVAWMRLGPDCRTRDSPTSVLGGSVIKVWLNDPAEKLKHY